MTTPTLNLVQRARLAAALLAAERGWRVFPLLPGSKQPAIRQWEQRATTNPDHITAYWRAHPDHNTAIATGPSQLVVIDLDHPDHNTHPAGDPNRERTSGRVRGKDGLSMGGATSGAHTLTQLARHTGATIPDTHTVTTPSGGTHLYYRTPAGSRLRSTAGALGRLVDTRAHGGYVVAAGSTTPTGAYELLDDQDPAELPTWLHQALTPKPPPTLSGGPEVPSDRLAAYIATITADQAHRIATAAPGAHNKTLFVAACRLGELVGAGALNPVTAHHMLKQFSAHLITANCRCTEPEIEATITSGLRTGARNPRTNLPGHHQHHAHTR
ncbi:bifunctional DNA primase/polymerase [Pseudonocardia spinosispora]|uniref:bifunctional DNA primase/polymerase n=1 Tax=Pseudonocardia spinosispora TaxID=103441 RepID=UPI000410376F|nr:bifunctional DNA primase/polymerase [Pseudonocardia spinosispora]